MGISVIVLAAGASIRMGRPKPLLDFDGRTCLSLVLSAALGSRADATILVLGADAERIAPMLGEMRLDDGLEVGAVKVVTNRHHSRGQTSSLKTGLEELPADADGFIVLPVDHPLVSSAVIERLIDRFEDKPRGRSIFIASYEGERGHPVLFTNAHRARVLELGDDEPLHNYVRVREGESEQVPVEDPGVIMPMNTENEYLKVLEAYRSREVAS